MTSRSSARILLASSVLLLVACSQGTPSSDADPAPAAKEAKKDGEKKPNDKKRDEKKSAPTEETAADGAAKVEANAETPVNLLNAPTSFTFEEREYPLAWSSHPSAEDYLMEYVPAGENLDRFDHMIMLEAQLNSVDPAKAVESLVTMLEERRGTDPVVNYALIQNEATGEYVIDFVMSDGDTVEWSAYRYAPLSIDGRSGTLLFGVSERGYEGGSFTPDMLLESLNQTRSAKIEALTRLELPTVKPVD